MMSVIFIYSSINKKMNKILTKNSAFLTGLKVHQDCVTLSLADDDPTQCGIGSRGGGGGFKYQCVHFTREWQ